MQTWYDKEWRYDGKVSLYNKKELKQIKIFKNAFILRVNSKAFKKMYSLTYEKGWRNMTYFIKDDIGPDYIDLYRKALKNKSNG